LINFNEASYEGVENLVVNVWGSTMEEVLGVFWDDVTADDLAYFQDLFYY
jgi:hypothetical protein